MSYQIDFKGRGDDSIVVDNERGEKLKALWFGGDQKDTPVDIDGNAYLIGSIKAIKQVADPKPYIPDFDRELLPSGEKCRGEFSIQREINQVIKHDFPKTWMKLISNQPKREYYRKQLSKMPGVEWCDAKAGKCACKV